MKLFFALALIALPVSSHAGKREGGVYALLGMDRASMSLKSASSSESAFEGYGLNAEVGLEFPWSSDGRSGWSVAGFGRKSDLRNKGNNTTLSENGDYSSYGGRLGLYFGGVTFGAGYSVDKLDTTAVSSLGGNSEVSISGNETFLFLNLTYNMNKQLLSVVEISYGQGSMDTLDSSTLFISLKVGMSGFTD